MRVHSHDRGWLTSSGEAACGGPGNVCSMVSTPDPVSGAELGDGGSRGQVGRRSPRVRDTYSDKPGRAGG